VSPAPNDRERITDWTKRYWDALHPHSAGGASQKLFRVDRNIRPH